MKQIQGRFLLQSNKDFPADCEMLDYMQTNAHVVSIIGNLAGGYLLASVGVPVYCFICGGAMFLSMAIFLMGKPFSAAK